MKLDRLFNVLVLGGAALAACGSDAEDKDTGDDSSANDDQDDGEPTADDGQQNADDGEQAADEEQSTDGEPSGDDGDDGDDEQMASDDGEDSPDASMTVSEEDAGAAALECSETPSPGDPCGCPCCWGGGLNTDDSCMGFCEAGNNGKGCCDV